jgi:hypothetical protein
MTTGEKTGIVFTVIITGILSIAMIHHKFRENEFKAWLNEVEAILGCNVPEDDIDSILRDLFTDGDVTIEYAVELYKEIKGGL